MSQRNSVIMELPQSKPHLWSLPCRSAHVQFSMSSGALCLNVSIQMIHPASNYVRLQTAARLLHGKNTMPLHNCAHLQCPMSCNSMCPSDYRTIGPVTEEVLIKRYISTMPGCFSTLMTPPNTELR